MTIFFKQEAGFYCCTPHNLLSLEADGRTTKDDLTRVRTAPHGYAFVFLGLQHAFRASRCRYGPQI
jgi:hypothetical protein